MFKTRRGNSYGSGDGAHASHTAASFTDLMASLMVIFILLFVATVSNAVKKANSGRRNTKDELLEQLRREIERDGTRVTTDDKDQFAVVIVMPEQLLFASGVSTVGESGQEYLQRMTPVLSRLVCSPDRVAKIASVVVEGHTDAKWLGATAPGVDGQQKNLELSQQRSMDVVRWGLASLPPGGERDCFRRLLSASGRGQEELLPGIEDYDPRQRRVVFKIRTQQDAEAQVSAGLAELGRR